jgi:hypothetical protein
MELNSPFTEIILNQSCSTLCHLSLDWTPEPGTYLEIERQTYLVLERRHRYQLRSGRYHLHQIALYVQTSVPTEQSLLEGRWVIGDSTCLYNAHSEILRCAINPSGPCDRCSHYQPCKKQSLN